jgi:transposase
LINFIVVGRTMKGSATRARARTAEGDSNLEMMFGIEACGTPHHWAHELIKLGHEVRLMPPAYVKPYVKRGKTDGRRCGSGLRGSDAADSAVRAVKTPEQQAALSIHRTRDRLRCS